MRLRIAFELIRIAQLLTSGLGCCPTTAPQRREKKKWYKRNRKKELIRRKKFRTKIRPETRDRPGGVTHEKRKVYRPRNFPATIPQPERSPSMRDVKVNNPHKPHPVPQNELKPIRSPRQVRVENTKKT